MRRYRIYGADKETGKDIESHVVYADSEDDATSGAAERGVMISSIEDLGDAQKPEAIPDTNIVKTLSDHEDPSTNTILMFVGGIAFLVGLVCCFYFCFVYETTVSSGRYGLDKVNNIGLMNNRLVGVIAGMGVALIGTISFVVGIIVNRLDDLQQNQLPQPPKE